MAPRRKQQWIQKTGLLWPDEKHPEWCFIATWAAVEGRPECVGLEIWKGAGPDTKDPGSVYVFGDALKPIQAADLRGLPIGSIVHRLRQRASELETQRRRLAGELRAERVDQPEVLAALEPALALLEAGDGFASQQERTGPGRRPVYDQGHFVEVARIYLGAWRNGEPPTEAVRRHFDVTKSTAAKWVARARNEFGLLDETTPGRSSGVAPKKARKR